MNTTTQQIWRPETGITDIEVPWKELAASEIESIRKIWAEQRGRLKGSSQLSRFTERLSREWAIETGIIENLYQIERGVTQTLIERGFQAEFLTHGSTNKPTSYVINLLKDQQDALDGIFDFIKQNRGLSTSYIKELHAALVRSQDHTDGQDPSGKLIEIPLIKGDWKIQPNYPTKNGVVFAYCPPEQVASEMDRLVELHKAHLEEGVAPEVEAAWLHHRFSQIHPFQDGNGRVCRALASMVLVRAGLFPLVVTRDDKDKYLDALEAADKGSLGPLVELFAALQRTQFRKATALSENMLVPTIDVASIMSGLMKAAEKSREEREQELRKVFAHSDALESDTAAYLNSLVPNLQQVMLSASPKGAAFVKRSTPATSHYYWGQIIENARTLEYFVDNSSYRAWVTLNMIWNRQARLVFAFHGIGRPFSGSLICAPFLEFRDLGEDDQTHSTVMPVTDEGFVFFYNEPLEQIKQRFQTWREKVVAVALKQLGKACDRRRPNSKRSSAMIEGLKPYAEYKASGLPWLGSVPAHWVTKRGKSYMTAIDRRSQAGKEELLTVSSARGVIPRNTAKVTMFKAESYAGYKLCWPGDLVINSLWAWGGGLGVTQHHGIISTAYSVYRPRPSAQMNPRFLHELVRSSAFHWELQVRSKGVWISRLQLTDTSFLDAPIPLPPPDEQAAIVRFLNHANRMIDGFIRAKRKLIGLLNDQKQAIIHRAVTRGLHTEVPLKPSGIPWLGDIPKHWEVRRAKYLFREVDDRSKEGKETHLAMSQRLGLVPSSMVDSAMRSESYAGAKLCQEGDLVLNRLKAHLGVFALAKQGGVISPDYSVFRKRAAISMEYYESVLKSSACRRELRIRAKGLVEGFWRLYTDDFYDIRLPVPPFDEQKEIMAAVAVETAALTTAIARTEREIALMQEYRTSLTADLVTGKLDVREAAAKLPAPPAEPAAVADDALEEIEPEEAEP